MAGTVHTFFSLDGLEHERDEVALQFLEISRVQLSLTLNSEGWYRVR